jgi:hypothetical protein
VLQRTLGGLKFLWHSLGSGPGTGKRQVGLFLAWHGGGIRRNQVGLLPSAVRLGKSDVVPGSASNKKKKNTASPDSAGREQFQQLRPEMAVFWISIFLNSL